MRVGVFGGIILLLMSLMIHCSRGLPTDGGPCKYEELTFKGTVFRVNANSVIFKTGDRLERIPVEAFKRQPLPQPDSTILYEVYFKQIVKGTCTPFELVVRTAESGQN